MKKGAQLRSSYADGSVANWSKPEGGAARYQDGRSRGTAKNYRLYYCVYE